MQKEKKDEKWKKKLYFNRNYFRNACCHFGIFMLYNKNEDKTERIAVIIPDIEESQWSAFKYGLKMASQEYGVNTILISKSNINLSEDEMEVVKQEIDKGADAIIVKMTGNSNEYSQLKKIQKKVPIMLAGESLAEIKKQSDIPVTEPISMRWGWLWYKNYLRKIMGIYPARK